jgi:hypothetical protein
MRANSCCKRRIMPACRSRIHLGNGSTCLHAHIRSSLISVKVRTAPSALTSRSPPPSFGLVFSCTCLWVMGCGVDLAPRCRARHILDIGLESVTQGLARATSHRVLAPAAGTSPRYSIPFFQAIALDLRLNEHVLQRTSLQLTSPHFCLLLQRSTKNFASYPLFVRTVPPEVLKLKKPRGEHGQTDCESDI